MENKNGINKAINSIIGQILVTIIPSISFYWAVLNKLKFDMEIDSIKVGISIIFGLLCLLYVKQLNIKSKIIELKKFRDFQATDFVNFNNSEIKKLADRLLKIEGRERADLEDEDKKRLFQQEIISRKEKIDLYNKAFEDWKCGDYGKTEQTKTFIYYE
jgi:hypothetical protein